MSDGGSRSAGLVPVFVSRLAPADAAEAPYLASQFLGDPVFGEHVAWAAKGAAPRWLGQDSSDCAAAFDPSIVHSRGADELKRFLAGAETRGETALLVATIGDLSESPSRSPLHRYDGSVSLPGFRGSIAGRRLPEGTRPVLAEQVEPAGRDLGLRLLNSSIETWWALSLHSTTVQPGAGGPPVQYEAQGRLEPVLQDALGEPVVAVWVPEDADERWYIVPHGADGGLIVDWLVRQALPAYVPDALRRARSPHFNDPELLTQQEAQAAEVLDEMKARHAEEEAEAERVLEQARESAEPVRYGLMYGTGDGLADAVAAVLRRAGIGVVSLDEELGTKSADHLASVGERRALVEVKSANGAASEALVGDLRRHMETWPALMPDVPIEGGVLVVNHHIKLHPLLRPGRVYTRPEFVATLPVQVVSSRELFDWWRSEDWDAIQQAVFGPEAAGPLPRVDTPDGSSGSRPRRRSIWRGKPRPSDA